MSDTLVSTGTLNKAAQAASERVIWTDEDWRQLPASGNHCSYKDVTVRGVTFILTQRGDILTGNERSLQAYMLSNEMAGDLVNELSLMV